MNTPRAAITPKAARIITTSRVCDASVATKPSVLGLLAGVAPSPRFDRRLPLAVEDRLRLGPLHAGAVRRAETGPFLFQNHKPHYLRRSSGDPSKGRVNAYAFSFRSTCRR